MSERELRLYKYLVNSEYVSHIGFKLIAKKLFDELQQKESIIKEVREEVRIYEEQSNDGTTNELDNYVFVQRLKKVLDKEVN